MLAPLVNAPPVTRAGHAFNALPNPLLVLHGDRRLVFANAAARALFADRRAHLQAEHLMSIGQIEAAKLEDLLHLALSIKAALAGLWFAADLQTGVLNVSSLGKTEAHTQEWPDDCLLLIAHLDQPRLSQDARIDALCLKSHLTESERYALLLLADGSTADQTAQQLQVCISTMRTHIRHILEKTHAPSLMQLLRWLGSAAGLPQSA